MRTCSRAVGGRTGAAAGRSSSQRPVVIVVCQLLKTTEVASSEQFDVVEVTAKYLITTAEACNEANTTLENSPLTKTVDS